MIVRGLQRRIYISCTGVYIYIDIEEQRVLNKAVYKFNICSTRKAYAYQFVNDRSWAF